MNSGETASQRFGVQSLDEEDKKGANGSPRSRKDLKQDLKPLERAETDTSMKKKDEAGRAFCFIPDSPHGRSSSNLRCTRSSGGYRALQGETHQWSSGCNKLQWLVSHSGSDIVQERAIHHGEALS